MEEEKQNFLNTGESFSQDDDLITENNNSNQAVTKEMSEENINELKTYVSAIEGALTKIRSLIAEGGTRTGEAFSTIEEVKEKLAALPSDVEPDDGNEKIVEGVFDGEFMIGSNGNKYNVPQNYASKSKLVEGDLLKLIIGEKGNFIYKQIAPIDRDRLVGVLSKDPESGEFFVEVGHDIYRVILASVTYFHGEPGDEAIILKPKNTKSRWAAIENIVKA